jgi:cytoplasmic iron level regulating protein YaaA (DUF328/UPF0246 family)
MGPTGSVVPNLARVLILLPPSEGKTTPRRGRPLDPGRLSFTDLTEARGRVLDALVEHCRERPADAAVALGLGPTQADLVRTNAMLPTAPTARAERVYSGVLYEALDLPGLDPAARRRASRWLAVQSALLGLVRPQDPIPAYRLSGDTTLPGVGKVAAWWRGHLDETMRAAVGGGLLVDLRSATYATFWRPTGPRTATVRVLHETGGRRSVVSHFNKATKGRLVRALLEHGSTPRTPAALADQLRDLGWTVEPHEPGPHGQQLDVVVGAL